MAVGTIQWHCGRIVVCWCTLLQVCVAQDLAPLAGPVSALGPGALYTPRVVQVTVLVVGVLGGFVSLLARRPLAAKAA